MTSLGVVVGWYDMPGLVTFEVAVGTRPQVALLSFDDISAPWSSTRAAPFLAHGVTPQLTWGAAGKLADIAAGKWDTQISQTARWSQGGPIRVRFAHEMNGPFSPYYGDPATYVAAWKRARKVWRAAGNTAPWIWSPNVTDGGTHPFDAYYPGDDQCELVGLDGYCYPKEGNHSFADLFDADLTTLGRLSARPLAICETGIDKASPDRAAWITGMWTYLLQHPRIEHVAYWDRDTYKISDDPAASLAFHLGAGAWLA